jgi:hypothetical protein
MSAVLINNGSLLFSGIWAFCETIVIFTMVFKFFSKIIKRLDRIEYALYNDGKTGLVNKVEELLENQQCIRVDVEILKVKAEQ